MPVLILDHATVQTPDTRLENATLLIENGIIKKIDTEGASSIPRDVRNIDARESIVVPGLIDLQLNGAFGDDFTANPETIWRVAEKLPRYGVTSFLPTLVTSPLERADAALDVLRQRPPDFVGAEPLGLHLEGPFLNPKKKGAHNANYMRTPDAALVPNWSRAQGVWLVTIAPELPGALELAKTLIARGVVVSMGHTMATLEEANAGYNAGIQYATHLYNAMPPLEHRAPGAVGAVLTNPKWLTGILPDGIHVHPTMVHAAWLAKGAGNLNLVSDAMAALGMPPGTYRLNDLEVTVSETEARLTDGTLAGSIISLSQALRNFLAYTGCSLADALDTVTTVPARLLSIQHERGSIAEGMIADLVLLDPNLDVKMTIVRGQPTKPQ